MQIFVAVSLVAQQQMQSISVRALATTGAKRSQLLPELPTIADRAIRTLCWGSWNGFFAPVRTPKPVLEKINDEILRGLEQPKVRERLITLGQEFHRSTLPATAPLSRPTSTLERAGSIR